MASSSEIVSEENIARTGHGPRVFLADRSAVMGCNPTSDHWKEVIISRHRDESPPAVGSAAEVSGFRLIVSIKIYKFLIEI